MSFVAAVQHNRIAGPAQRQFTPASWDDAFAAAADPSDADRRLHDAGRWFAAKFAEAREVWDELPRLAYEPADLVRYFVGALNFQTTHARYAVVDAARDARRAAGADPAAERTAAAWPDLHRLAAETADRVEHLISSARIPLSNALAGREPRGAERPNLSAAQALLAGLQMRSILGAQYSALERLWNQCVWSGWYVDVEGEGDAVRPTNIKREAWLAAAAFRRDSLLTETALRLQHIWRRGSRADRAGWAGAPVIVRVERHGRRLKLIPGRAALGGEAPPYEWLRQTAAGGLYLDAFFDAPLPHFGDLTVRDLLRVRWLLAPLEELLASGARALSEVISPDDLRACAPVLRGDDIAAAIAAGTGLPRDQAHRALAVLTFDGTARDDLWRKPFVRLAGDDYVVLCAPLGAPNLAWVIDGWMRDGGLDMPARGPTFEDYLRRELAEATRLPNACVYPADLTVRAGTTEEQVDLLVRVGRTVVVGEAKCSVFPTDPYALAAYEERLREAGGQAARKATFLAAHQDALVDATGWEDLRGAPVTWVPVAVSNLSLGPGYAGGGAPVVDRLILSRYLGEGYVEQMVTISAERVNNVGRVVRFYASPAEAEVNTATYLRDPPQLTLLANSVRVEWRPLHHREHARPVLFATFRAAPSTEPPDSEG